MWEMASAEAWVEVRVGGSEPARAAEPAPAPAQAVGAPSDELPVPDLDEDVSTEAALRRSSRAAIEETILGGHAPVPSEADSAC